jgi:hypothetical protein
MSEELERDIIHEWTLERGNHHTTHRFRLRCTVTSPFLEPTRHEVRDALAQVLDEALGPDPVESDIGDWVAETSELLYSEEMDLTELTDTQRFEALEQLLEVLPTGGVELLRRHGYVRVT